MLPVPMQACESIEFGLRLFTTAGKPVNGTSPAAAMPPMNLRLLVFVMALTS